MSDEHQEPVPIAPLRISELPATERPRERLTRLGASALNAVELLALVIGSGGNGNSALDLATQVFARNGGSLRRLAASPVASIRAINGVGPAKAVVLHAALELGRRMAAESRTTGEPVSGPMDVYRLFAPRLEDLPVEEFHVAVLDTQHRLERDITVTRGL
jgi:DNA repair protein RadC